MMSDQRRGILFGVMSYERCLCIAAVAVVFSCVCPAYGQLGSDDSDADLPVGFSFLGGSSRSRFKNELRRWHHSSLYNRPFYHLKRTILGQRWGDSNRSRVTSTTNRRRPNHEFSTMHPMATMFPFSPRFRSRLGYERRFVNGIFGGTPQVVIHYPM